MKFCYCDESGMGEEPIATMVGVVVDADRMHRTKAAWMAFLGVLSDWTGRKITELHMRDLYRGNSPYRKAIDGPDRAQLITRICEWIAERKHHFVYAAVVKEDYRQAWARQDIPDELGTIWRFMGFHLMLAMQRRSMREQKRKGNTVFIFDNEGREAMRFADLVQRPPEWSDEYYDRPKKTEPLDQVIDIPYFGDSKDVSLIQIADFAAYILRRYAEVESRLTKERYGGEGARLQEWAQMLAARSIGRGHIYPKVGRNEAHNLFFNLAPEPIRTL